MDTPPSPQVLDVVKAAEQLALGTKDNVAIPPKSPGGPRSAGESIKTTTVVMSKHTLSPQTPSPERSPVSEQPSLRSLLKQYAWLHEPRGTYEFRT